jgi:type IV secretion system protein TrbB
VFIKGRGPGRRVETTVEVKGLDLSGDYVLETPSGLPSPINHP